MSEDLDLYKELDEAREKIANLRQRLAAAEAIATQRGIDLVAMNRELAALRAEHGAWRAIRGTVGQARHVVEDAHDRAHAAVEAIRRERERPCS